MNRTALTDPALLTPCDTDCAMSVLEYVADQCAKIRGERDWTRSGDLKSRHEFGLLDIERTLIPRCKRHNQTGLATFIQGFVNGQREAFAAR